MSFFLSAVKIVFLLGTLITIHELGHFLVARLFKVKVLKFAIGFGPKIFTKTTSKTEYTLRLIPFGGFVQMEGEEKRSDDPDSFSGKPVWQRILVVLAGPLVNIIFAIMIFFFLSTSQNIYEITKIKNIDSNLYEYGFRNGDEIVSINNKGVTFGSDVSETISVIDDDNLDFEIKRDGKIINLPIRVPVTTRGLLGVGFDSDGRAVYIVQNMPIVDSELKLNDKVIAINGVTMYSTEEIVETIRNNPNSNVKLTVLRDNEKTISFEVYVSAKTDRFLDFSFEVSEPLFPNNLYYAFKNTTWYLGENIKGYAKLFTGNTENVEVMGVVGIADEIAKTTEVFDFFYMMCAISLSLGIFNLFPIPALDGGRILLLLIEGIRRKPLNEKLEQIVIVVSFILIIIFAIIVTFWDVSKFFK